MKRVVLILAFLILTGKSNAQFVSISAGLPIPNSPESFSNNYLANYSASAVLGLYLTPSQNAAVTLNADYSTFGIRKSAFQSVTGKSAYQASLQAGAEFTPIRSAVELRFFATAGVARLQIDPLDGIQDGYSVSYSGHKTTTGIWAIGTGVGVPIISGLSWITDIRVTSLTEPDASTILPVRTGLRFTF